MNYIFDHFQITLNKHSFNVTGRTFVQSEHWQNVLGLIKATILKQIYITHNIKNTSQKKHTDRKMIYKT